MSEELINQLTLNFLISKNQLQKLNKKIKEDVSQVMKTDKEVYGDRIKKLFDDLLMNNSPDDLLYDVRSSFDLFLNKCIYYLKAHDNNQLLEKERQEKDDISDDINFEKEERDIENGNYEENSNHSEEEGEEGEEGEEETNIQPTLIIKEKYTNKNMKSEGVDDIQKLPLNWFNNVRQNYKKNQIIPRRKEIKLEDVSLNSEKRKYK
jgi:hypothetical protein